MPLTSTRDRIAIPRGVVSRVLDGTTVLLDSASGRYFALDEPGTRAWTLLTSSPTFDAACASLLDEYEAAPERLRADLAALVEDLERLGLVEVARG